MKVSVEKKALADAAKAAAKFLPRVSHMAVLEHLELEAHSNQLMISATNLDAGRTVEVEADIEIDGRVLVPESFAKIVSAAGERLSLSVGDSKLTVTDGASTWRLPLGEIEDYPNPPSTDGDSYEIASWRHIQAVATAARKNDRPALQAVHFGDGFAAATDSYRLAWTECDAPEALVPAYAIRNLDAEVGSLKIGDRHASATLENGLWWTRLIDGSFPKWQTLIPPDPQIQATFSTEALSDALRRASFVAPEAGKQLKGKLVTLEFGDGITVRSGDDFTETVEADTEGTLEITFNISYLLDALDPVDKATFKLTDQFKPGLIESDWWNALIMPVRT